MEDVGLQGINAESNPREERDMEELNTHPENEQVDAVIAAEEFMCWDDEDEDSAEDSIWGNAYGFAETIRKNYELEGITPEPVRPNEDYPLLLVKFGHPELRYTGHMLSIDGGYKQFHRCIEDECIICKVDIRKVTWRIELFYSPQLRRIVYLEFEEKDRPQSLFPQLQGALAGGFPAVISVSKPDPYSFLCKRIAPTDSVDLGEGVIRRFWKAWKEENIDMDSLVPQATPDIARRADKVGDLVRVMGH